MRVHVIETPEGGHRSYLVSAGGIALVIDPQRDVDRVRALADELAVRIAMVLETHLHDDYLTGGHALARGTGATYVGSGRDDISYERCAARDRDEFSVGELRVRAVETPGHSDNHLSYVVSDRAGGTPAVFSGGSLLYGGVGRTDLLGDHRTRDLTRKQWRSARRLAAVLPDDAPLYPTHGFGSSSGGSDSGASTIGQERQRNDVLTEDDVQAFVDRVVATLPSQPPHCVHIRSLNAHGPDEPDLTPVRTLEPPDLAARIRTGEWVVDLRDRSAYAEQHLAGTVSIMLGDRFTSYAGAVIPWGAPVSLIGDSPEQVAEAQRQLSRIGIDRLAGAATGVLDRLAPAVPLRSYRQATFHDLARDPGALVLDVRRDPARGGRIAGARRIPLHYLVNRLDEVPRGRVWVHSASGFGAGIAASILDRAGHHVVHVNDGFVNAQRAGLPVVPPDLPSPSSSQGE